MFRGMRRFKQQLPEEIAVEILQSADSGILAVLDEEGYSSYELHIRKWQDIFSFSSDRA